MLVTAAILAADQVHVGRGTNFAGPLSPTAHFQQQKNMNDILSNAVYKTWKRSLFNITEFDFLLSRLK